MSYFSFLNNTMDKTPTVSCVTSPSMLTMDDNNLMWGKTDGITYDAWVRVDTVGTCHGYGRDMSSTPKIKYQARQARFITYFELSLYPNSAQSSILQPLIQLLLSFNLCILCYMQSAVGILLSNYPIC